jgi:hypothetical protein
LAQDWRRELKLLWLDTPGHEGSEYVFGRNDSLKPLATPASCPKMFKPGWPSNAVPLGKTVNESINTLTSGKGMTKSVCCEHGIEWTSSHQHQPHAQ